MAHDEVGWVRAADAARMLGISRERVRQLIASGALESKRESKRQVWVKVADIEARMAGTEGAPKDV